MQRRQRQVLSVSQLKISEVARVKSPHHHVRHRQPSSFVLPGVSLGSCSQGVPHLLTPPVRGRPVPRSAFGVRTPQKLFPARTATESSSYLYRLCPRSPVAAATRGTGLLLLSILTDSGGTVIIKHRPGVRCCGRRGGLFCYLFVATGKGENREENKERPGR